MKFIKSLKRKGKSKSEIGLVLKIDEQFKERVKKQFIRFNSSEIRRKSFAILRGKDWS
jgi:hypothetical protein